MLLSVFSQGDKGTSWYIIWKGSVNVVTHGKVSLPSLPSPLGLTSWAVPLIDPRLPISRVSSCLSGSVRHGSVPARAGRQGWAVTQAWLQGLVTTVHEGDDFGQLALVNDAPRAATIILREDNCHFLRVDKQDFNRIIKVPLLGVGRAGDVAGTRLWRSGVGQRVKTRESL